MDESNDTVKYRPYRDYFFEPKLSNGTEDDVITMINIPFVVKYKYKIFKYVYANFLFDNITYFRL